MKIAVRTVGSGSDLTVKAESEDSYPVLSLDCGNAARSQLWRFPFGWFIQKGEQMLPIAESEEIEEGTQMVPELYSGAKLDAALLIEQIC